MQGVKGYREDTLFTYYYTRPPAFAGAEQM